MKKKILYSLAILVGVIVIFNLPSCSCGSEKSDKLDTLIVKPETEKIKGPLGDCFKVLDRKYKGKYMDMISKYEVEQLKEITHRVDPQAFIILNEGSMVVGNFEKRL